MALTGLTVHDGYYSVVFLEGQIYVAESFTLSSSFDDEVTIAAVLDAAASASYRIRDEQIRIEEIVNDGGTIEFLGSGVDPQEIYAPIFQDFGDQKAGFTCRGNTLTLFQPGTSLRLERVPLARGPQGPPDTP